MNINISPDFDAITLRIKTLGRSSILSLNSIEDAIVLAVELITSGKAIPKSIWLNGKEVYSEADINLYWERTTKATP